MAPGAFAASHPSESVGALLARRTSQEVPQTLRLASKAPTACSDSQAGDQRLHIRRHQLRGQPMPVLGKGGQPLGGLQVQLHRMRPVAVGFFHKTRCRVHIAAGADADKAVAAGQGLVDTLHFQGHFPGRPLMPGVLIVEAMAQVGGLIVTQMPDLPQGLFVFAGIDGVRFRRPVVPGDQLRITCELLSLKRKRFGKVKAEATVDGQLVCSGELMFSLVD